tara:strand:+ start:469 stop:798 length:330 start_codon:yes stop_codon:yes gene_type:complete
MTTKTKAPEAPEAPAPVYCSLGDLIGTPDPRGGVVTRVVEADSIQIVAAAAAVTKALAGHPDATGKVALVAARWANIAGAVDLICLGEPGEATDMAMSALLPVKDEDGA